MKDLVILIGMWFLTWGLLNIWYKWLFKAGSLTKYFADAVFFFTNFVISYVFYKNIIPTIYIYIYITFFGHLLSQSFWVRY